MANVSDRQIFLAFESPVTIKQAAKDLGLSTSKLRKRMKHLGIKPQGLPFARGVQIRCADGHFVDSIGEARVDNFLSKTEIKHRVHWKLVGLPCIIDFWLPDHQIGIEYVGLEGVPAYQERIAEKKRFYAKWEIPVVWVYPETPIDASLIHAIKRVLRHYRAKKDARQKVLLK